MNDFAYSSDYKELHGDLLAIEQFKKRVNFPGKVFLGENNQSQVKLVTSG